MRGTRRHFTIMEKFTKSRIYFFISCLAFLIAKAYSAPQLEAADDPAPTPAIAQPGNGNQYIDELLNNTQTLIVERGFDPLNVGQVDMCSNCVIEGLRTVRRTGDATIDSKEYDVILNINLGFDDLNGRCDCSRKVLFFNLRGTVTARLQGLAMRGTVIVRTDSFLTSKPVLEDFEVTNNGRLDLDWDGQGFVGLLSEGVFRLFRGKITRNVQSSIPGVIRSAIENNLDKVASLGRKKK